MARNIRKQNKEGLEVSLGRLTSLENLSKSMSTKPSNYKIKRENRNSVVNSLTGLAEGMIKGIGGLLGFAAEMEREGKSEHIERGEIKGKAKSGEEYRGAYGLRIKVGLNEKIPSTKHQIPNKSQ